MSEGIEWQARLAFTAQRLGFQLLDGCIKLNTKHCPRYYHANVAEIRAPGHNWRLKVVNPARQSEVGHCNRYNNSVHQRLAQTDAITRIACVPKFFDVPKMFDEEASVSQLMANRPATVHDGETIVEYLVNAHVQRHSVKAALRDPNGSRRQPVNVFNQSSYRERLEHSMEGISGSIPIIKEEVISAFDARWKQPLPDDALTFAHGDFSIGNLQIGSDNRLGLLDFEHSHIGLGCIDLAHMYVNLAADGNKDAALAYRAAYRDRANRERVWFDLNVFEAVVLERAAGKMNAMDEKNGEHFERLSDMLKEIIGSKNCDKC